MKAWYAGDFLNSHGQTVLLKLAPLAGHTYIMLHGYKAGQSPQIRQRHAEMLLKDTSGIHFFVATVSHSKDPAVLVGLTDQAAMHFAKRHIYGLAGPAGQRQLKWQQMSLSTARYTEPSSLLLMLVMLINAEVDARLLNQSHSARCPSREFIPCLASALAFMSSTVSESMCFSMMQSANSLKLRGM